MVFRNPTEERQGFGCIFDMDGVLIDSYRAHFESWRMIAAEEGLHITELQFAKTFGRTSREIIAALWGEKPCDEAKIADLDRRKEAAFRDLIRENFPIMPGARELLDELRADGFLLAIGSSGPPENVALTLERLGRQSLFSAVVTGMDVMRGKPDPQVFLLAAERLGLAPERCVVIEDAPAGIEAAHAAGAKAVGLASTGRTHQDLAAADLVVDHLHELSPALLRTLISPRLHG